MRVLTNGGTDQGWTLVVGDTLSSPTEPDCWPLEELGGNYQFHNNRLLSNFFPKILAWKIIHVSLQSVPLALQKFVLPHPIKICSGYASVNSNHRLISLIYSYFSHILTSKHHFSVTAQWKSFCLQVMENGTQLTLWSRHLRPFKQLLFETDAKEIDFVLRKQLNVDSILSAIQF